LWLGLWGIRWCLPSRARLLRVLPEETDNASFRKYLDESWQSLYAGLGPEPLLNPNIFTTGFSNVTVVPPGWKIPPAQLINSARSFYLRTGHEDEAPILVALSRIKPGRLEFNPRIYTYGGAYMYFLGAWIAALMAVTSFSWHLSLPFYLSHLDQLAHVYLFGRFLTTFAFVVGDVFVCFLGRRFWNTETGLWAALFFATSPGIVLGAHVMKPHLLGTVFILATFYYCARVLRDGDDRSWLYAGTMAGLAAGSAPYLGLCTALLPITLCLQIVYRGKAPRACLTNLLLGSVACIAVFFLTNPFFIYEPGTSWKALFVIGQASARNASYMWKFPIYGIPRGCGILTALWILRGLISRRNFQEPVRMLATAGFLFYLLNSWILQSADSLIGTRNFPAFFLGFLLAGLSIADWLQATPSAWKRSLIRTAAGISVAYAALLSSLIDYNLHVDSTELSTRFVAGDWIGRNIPAGSELGFLRLFQPSNAPYFQWNHYRLKFVDPRILEAPVAPERAMPETLILTSSSYDDRLRLMALLEKHYVCIQSFPPVSWGPLALRPGEIYGNPLIEIYKRKGPVSRNDLLGVMASSQNIAARPWAGRFN
jgi:hypothetical protein